jgi:hypothetical protein
MATAREFRVYELDEKESHVTVKAAGIVLSMNQASMGTIEVDGQHIRECVHCTLDMRPGHAPRLYLELVSHTASPPNKTEGEKP